MKLEWIKLMHILVMWMLVICMWSAYSHFTNSFFLKFIMEIPVAFAATNITVVIWKKTSSIDDFKYELDFYYVLTQIKKLLGL